MDDSMDFQGCVFRNKGGDIPCVDDSLLGQGSLGILLF
jgi:hypothetical protein